MASARRAFGAQAGLRYIGDPDMPIGRVLVGSRDGRGGGDHPGDAEVDPPLTGDVRSGAGRYVFDSQQVAAPQALIAVGRILLGAAGMAAVAGTGRDRRCAVCGWRP